MDLHERIKDVTSASFNEMDIDLLAEIYKEVFFEPLCKTCTKDIYNARIKLKKYYLNPNNSTVMETSASKYRFKKEHAKASVRIRTKRGVKTITAETLTDEDAEIMLKDKELKDLIEDTKTAKLEEKKDPVK